MKYVLLIFTLLALSGCKVGPNYHRPFTPMPLEFSEDRKDDTFSMDDEDFYRWWAIFEDDFLNALLEETLQGNFDYRIALEQIFEARSQYWLQTTQLFPEFDFDFQATRYRVSRSFRSATTPASSGLLSPVQDFFQTGFDAIWQLDIWGKLRRASEAAYDLWEASAEEARAVKIIVLSEVANTYAVICSFQEQVNLGTQIVEIDEELLELAKSRFEAGLANEQEVDAAIAALEADTANLHLAQIGFKLNMYSLATLLGRQPETLVDDFLEKHPIPSASGRIPAGLPADLLRRRPDIRNAERNLAAATEQIGVAVADLYPQVSLLGSSSSFAANPLQGSNIGFSSDRIGKLFDSASRIWGFGALVTFPVFDFGKRVASINIQESLAQQSYLTYQKTVIEALQEVEQALVSYFNDEKRVGNYSKEAEANRRIYLLLVDEFQAGLADYTQVLEAKETWIISMNTLTIAQQALATDLIAVYKAMGGDW